MNNKIRTLIIIIVRLSRYKNKNIKTIYHKNARAIWKIRMQEQKICIYKIKDWSTYEMHPNCALSFSCAIVYVMVSSIKSINLDYSRRGKTSDETRGGQARQKDQGNEEEDDMAQASETALYWFPIDQSGLRNLDDLSLRLRTPASYLQFYTVSERNSYKDPVADHFLSGRESSYLE